MTEDTYRDKLNSLQVEIEELRAKLATWPEVTLCKDCVWYQHDDCTCPYGMFMPDADDYCSCATRRREDG